MIGLANNHTTRATVDLINSHMHTDVHTNESSHMYASPHIRTTHMSEEDWQIYNECIKFLILFQTCFQSSSAVL